MPGPAAAAGARAAAAAAAQGARRVAPAGGGSSPDSGGGGPEAGGEGLGAAAKLAIALAAALLGFLLLVLAPILLFIGGSAASACGAPGASVSGRYELEGSDPADLPALEIASRIYLVGDDMGFGRREVLTAFTVALVESGGGVTMANVYGGHASSTGVFQQQAFAPWTKRNRQNVAAAAATFFEQLRSFDRGQSIGELAADIQRPLESLRYKYGAALPKAREFYVRVEASLGQSGTPVAGLVSDGAACASATGPANLRQAVTLHSPRRFVAIPPRYTAYGQDELIDARLLDDVVYLARRYQVAITQGRGGVETGSPSSSHGYGTQIDIVPAGGRGWDATVGKLGSDLGWTRACGGTGERPACDLVPAICCIYYDGFTGHGEGHHMHVGWVSSAGPSDGHIHPPTAWVKAFPTGSAAGSKSEGGASSRTAARNGGARSSTGARR